MGSTGNTEDKNRPQKPVKSDRSKCSTENHVDPIIASRASGSHMAPNVGERTAKPDNDSGATLVDTI